MRYLIILDDLSYLEIRATNDLDAWFYALNRWGTKVQDVIWRD